MIENEASDSAGVQEVSCPRFAAFYNWMMGRPLVRRMFDPLRNGIIGQAHGVVLEVGAGGGQNFPFYDQSQVERVEAVEPDEVMLVFTRRLFRLWHILTTEPSQNWEEESGYHHATRR